MELLKKCHLWPGVLQCRIESCQLATTCSNATEVAQWATPICSRQLPAADNASETVDPIDWSHQRTPLP